MAFERIKQRRGKSKITSLELSRILRTVNTCQVKYEIAVSAVIIKINRIRIYIVFIDLINNNTRSGLVLTVSYVLKIINKSGTDHSFCAG